MHVCEPSTLKRNRNGEPEVLLNTSQVNVVQDVLHLSRDLLLRHAPDPGEELEVLPRGQLVEEDVVLGADAGHPADHGHVVLVADVVAEYRGLPRRHGGHARQHVEEGCLPGAVVTCSKDHELRMKK